MAVCITDRNEAIRFSLMCELCILLSARSEPICDELLADVYVLAKIIEEGDVQVRREVTSDYLKELLGVPLNFNDLVLMRADRLIKRSYKLFVSFDSECKDITDSFPDGKTSTADMNQVHLSHVDWGTDVIVSLLRSIG